MQYTVIKHLWEFDKSSNHFVGVILILPFETMSVSNVDFIFECISSNYPKLTTVPEGGVLIVHIHALIDEHDILVSQGYRAFCRWHLIVACSHRYHFPVRKFFGRLIEKNVYMQVVHGDRVEYTIVLLPEVFVTMLGKPPHLFYSHESTSFCINITYKSLLCKERGIWLLPNVNKSPFLPEEHSVNLEGGLY